MSDSMKESLLQIVIETKQNNSGNNNWSESAKVFNEMYGMNYSGEQLRSIYRNMNRNTVVNEDESSVMVRIKEAQKMLVRQRAIVDLTIKEYAERSIVSDTIKSVWGKEPFHLTKTVVIKSTKSDFAYIYGFADVHWGYFINEDSIVYNEKIAEKRMWEIAHRIVDDVKLHGYKEIYIADDGDQIEGAALRESQLLRIVECMTKQAKQYSNCFISIIKWVSSELPDVKITVLEVSEDNHAQLRLYKTKRNELPDNLADLITNTVANVVNTAHEYNGMRNVEYICADEILLSIGDKPFNIVLAHSHQYGRNDDILKNVGKRHKRTIHLFIGAHWHQFKVVNKDVEENTQTSVIFLPPVVGDTDYSESLFLSSLPAFAKITINLTKRVANAECILLDN